MPKWSEYVEEARARGSLAAEFFMIRSKPIAPPERVKEILPRHLSYQVSLQNQHKLASIVRRLWHSSPRFAPQLHPGNVS